MFSVNKEAESHVVGHMSNHAISWDWNWKDVQRTFLKKLMNILNRKQSYKGDIDNKVDDFSSIKM